jgi:hypothetical protein
VTQAALDFSPPPARKPSLEKVYLMLVQAGARGVTSGEFANAYVLRYAARLHELKGLGMVITKEKLEGRSSWRYVLRSAA